MRSGRYKMVESLAQRVVPETPVVPPVEVSTENQPVTSVAEIPLEKRQYVKELLEIGEASTQFEMPTLIKEIDDYVLSESGVNKDSYKEIIDSFLRKLNIPTGIDIYTKVERLASLIRIQKKLNDSAKEREELLKKQPSEMTSQQLRKFIEMKG